MSYCGLVEAEKTILGRRRKRKARLDLQHIFRATPFLQRFPSPDGALMMKRLEKISKQE